MYFYTIVCKASCRWQVVCMIDLQDETLLVFPHGCYYIYLLEELLHSHSILPKQVIEYDSVSAIIAGLCAGLRISPKFFYPVCSVKQFIPILRKAWQKTGWKNELSFLEMPVA